MDPSPQGNFTPPTILECGETQGDLEPVYDHALPEVESLWNTSFFLWRFTVHPSPLGKFTPPTKQECGETLGDLEPVYDLFPITSD